MASSSRNVHTENPRIGGAQFRIYPSSRTCIFRITKPPPLACNVLMESILTLVGREILLFALQFDYPQRNLITAVAPRKGCSTLSSLAYSAWIDWFRGRRFVSGSNRNNANLGDYST